MVASALALVLTVADFDAIVGGVSQRTHAESCTAIKAWATENVADPRARRGLVWCARLLWTDHDLDPARSVLERVLKDRSDDDPAMQALSTLGEIDFSEGRYAQAAVDYRALAASPIELWRYSGEQALIEVERSRNVWWQAAASAIVLLAWLLWRLAVVRRALWPAPAEVGVLAPLLLLLAAIAITQPAEVARGLGMLVLGGVALAWLNGAYWRARPPQGRARLLEALKGVTQAVLLVDGVLVSSGLWRSLWQSMTGGFD